MPTHHLPVTEPNIVARTLKRVEDLERRIRELGRGKMTDEAVWSLGGFLYETEFPRWYPEVGGQITKALVAVDIAGSTATTFEFRKSGVAIGALTLPPGVTAVTGYIGNHYVSNNGDYLNGATTAVGTDAEHLSAFVWMRR